MNKKILLFVTLLLGVVCFSGCEENGSGNSEDVVVLKSNKSVGDDILVESEGSLIYYYDFETESEYYACSQANCSHNIENFKNGDIRCNAIVDGMARYPFIYNQRLYYIIEKGEGDEYALWSSKTDGTDKKEELKLDFQLYTEGEYVRHQDKIYIASKEDIFTEYSTNKQEQTGSISEVYEIDLTKAKVSKITDFGSKADTYCPYVQFFDNKLFVRYNSRGKTYEEAGFKDVDHFLLWMESADFSYAEQIERLEEKNECYIYDFDSRKTELLNIGFESNFEPYKGITNMSGAYVLLCYTNDTVYYLDPVQAKYNIYSYNVKTKKRKEVFSSFKNVQLYCDGKIYITSMSMDESTKDDLAPSVDFKQMPKYYIYDISKDRLIEQNFGENQKIFYPIDRNAKGLLVYEVPFDEQYDLLDEHSFREISNDKIDD